MFHLTLNFFYVVEKIKLSLKKFILKTTQLQGVPGRDAKDT